MRASPDRELEMFKQHDLIPNETMGRPFHLWRYGHWGQPLLVFPSAAGFAHEWDAHGMVETLKPLIDAGKLKLYCTESNVAESWTRKETHPSERIQRHSLFERYVVEELAAFIRTDCQSPDVPIAVSGCSLGAYYAANIVLRHPATFRYALCMSGRYDMLGFTDGFSNDEIYFNNPLAFVPNLDGKPLERVRRHAHLDLVCGQGPWEEGCIEETHALGDLLAHKGISHQKDIWGRDVAHEWDWWRRQALFHLTRRYDSRSG